LLRTARRFKHLFRPDTPFDGRPRI
jgi:hypothetical protein